MNKPNLTQHQLTIRIEDLLAAEKFDEADQLLRNNATLVPDSLDTEPFQSRVVPKGFKARASQMPEWQFAIDFMTGLSRRARNARYASMVRQDPLCLRVLEEGDSWHHYPFVLDDLVENLRFKHAIHSVSSPSDKLEDMILQEEYSDAIAKLQPDVFMISAGGNDLLGNGRLLHVLNQYSEGASAAELINQPVFQTKLSLLEKAYQKVIKTALDIRPNLRIVLHGYDYAMPRVGQKWLATPLSQRSIPLHIGARIVRILLTRFDAMLLKLANGNPGRIIHVNLRDGVGGDPAEWHDEIHPKSPGFKRCSERILKVLDELARRKGVAHGSELGIRQLDRSRRARAFQGFGESPVPMLHPQSTGGALSDTTDVDSKHSRQQHDAALREFNRLNAEDYTEEDRERIEARLEYSRNSGTRSYEAIINTNDLDEYYFLSLGHEVGRAVGRVYVRGAQGGYGTGFLIAPGLLMTNNHVIPSRDAARLALVTFDHQLNADNTPLQAQHFQLSDALFMTSKALDYTIVKVAAHSTSGTPLEQYGYIELLPRSGKALKREHVCIIQHPGGNFKKVVVRGNEVVGRDELHLYYKSDTLPGSSGSPVFNTEWQIAALHHMAISDGTPDQGYVANRGIRISSILQDISRHRDMPGSDAEQIDAALQSVRSGPALPVPTSVPPVFLGAMADATEVRTPDPDDWAEGIGQTGSVLRAPEPESTRPSLSFTAASWPSNSKNAPDTWHLPSSAADATFDLNAELLQQIADTSHFVLHDGPLNTVIFALRGCRLADGTDMAEKRDDISLTTATVDHETPRCIIGVWHRASNQLSAYTGSTVPRRTEMKRYYDNVNFNIGSTLCNMLPTGCYEYCVGTHYSAKNGAVTYVLRQGDGPEPANRSTVTTLRTANDLTYGTWDIWDKCRPADNIHPGFIPGSFSSQGCLTLSGRQSGHGASHTTGTGNWSRFRKSAGFDGKNHGETYPVLLITGHEAAAFAQAVDDNARAALSCLRHGSTGPQVAALQALVKSKQDGIFGPSTKLAVAELQYSKLSFATGSWNHEMEALLA